jgi:hypothetical protein
MSSEETSRDQEPDITEERPRRSYTREGLEEAGVGFLKALGDGLGTLLDRGAQEIETVAKSGKSQYDLLQARRERDALYQKLGRTLYLEAQAGERPLPAHQELLDDIARAIAAINQLEADRKAEQQPSPEKTDQP